MKFMKESQTTKFELDFLLLGFTPCKAEQPPRNMALQEKEVEKD